MSADDLPERLAAVRGRIEAAAARAGRDPADVTLVGVAKRKPAALVAAAVRAGLRDIGESYAQEAREKLPAVRAALEADSIPGPRWHFIGQLQRNKVRDVVREFDVVATLDRTSLGAALERRAAGREQPLDVLLQVDLSGEAQKGGVAPEALPELLAACQEWSHLRVVGLMSIPAPTPDPEQMRPAFIRLRELRDSLSRAPGNEHLRELSMGMTADFEQAVEEGATVVRVGTAIFGARED